MLKIPKYLGIIAFFVVLGFIFLTCVNPEPEPETETELTPLSGTVNITGTAVVGQTLTANTSNLNGSGTITYQWQRNGSTTIGSDRSTYVIQSADIGSKITVTVTRSGNSGSITSNPSATVTTTGQPPITGDIEVTIAMWDKDSDGWNGNAALRINVNSTNLSTNARLENGGGPGYYTFSVASGDVVTFYWLNGGQYDYECAFAVYYSNTPPSPAFNPNSNSWSPSNDPDGKILLYKQFNNSGIVGDGTMIGSFTVNQTNTNLCNDCKKYPCECTTQPPITENIEVTVAMWDRESDGWDGNAALGINVNSTNLSTNASLANGGGPGYYTFFVASGDVVTFYWLNGGQYDYECAFAVYYSNNPPDPSFNPNPDMWSTANDPSGKVLLFKQFSSSGSVGNGTQIGSFTVGENQRNDDVIFNSVTANGSSTQTTTQLTLTFSQAIPDLDSNDITLSGIIGLQKGILNSSGSTYTLPISGFTTGGTLNVSVEKFGFDIIDSPKTVTIYYYVISVGITINLSDINEWELTEQSAQVTTNTNRVFNVAGTYTTYRWYLDGISVGTSASYTFNKPAGIYQLVVVVTNSTGESRSGQCRITVGPFLNANIWVNGSIAVATGEDWYSFPVTSGTTYRIWWDDSKQGSGTKTGDVAVSARYENTSTFLFGGTNTSIDSGYNTAQFFTANQTGTVLIRVIPYNRGSSYVGTYSLVYSTSTTRPAFYTVVFNANSGSGTLPNAQTVNAGTSIILPDGSSLTRNGYTFGGWNSNTSGTGTNFNAGSSYTPTANITLYAKWNSTTSTTLLTANTWANGTLSATNSEIWYSFSVTNGTTYRIWWNDSYQGNSTKTGDLAVSARYSSSSSWIFGGTDTDVDSGYNTAQSFTANQTGTVEIRVIPYGRGSQHYGTFGIVYSTSTTRPAL